MGDFPVQYPGYPHLFCVFSCQPSFVQVQITRSEVICRSMWKQDLIKVVVKFAASGVELTLSTVSPMFPTMDEKLLTKYVSKKSKKLL